MKITREIAGKVLSIVDQGLVKGLGIAEPGKMCIEAAVCFALGEPHNDKPTCVAPAVRAAKVTLNDATWSSDQARAKGLRRVAIAQLGSTGIDEVKFATYVAEQTIRRIVPIALENAAKLASVEHALVLREAAKACADQGTESAAWSAAWSAESAARSAASAAWSAAESAARSAAWSAESAAESAESAAWSARSAVWSARSAGDSVLCLMAEILVEGLQLCNSPGCEFLDLAEAA